MEKFYFITHENRDAYFNLASEEYLLKQKGGYYFYLWINDPAVIVGINQNAFEEVNLSYVQENGIKVVRRLTGGGTVYHDGGNLCYTVIAPYDKDVDNYRKFTSPVIEYLNELGVPAEFSGRNDITVDGKKISGNAQTVYGDKIMHHGTILFDTDPDALTLSLNPNKLKIESKGIKSVRARVTNIKDRLQKIVTIEQFKKGLADKFLSFCQPYTFNQQDEDAINKLVEEKYSHFEWNMGRSPKGKNVFTKKFAFGVLTISFDTEKGVMQNVSIMGDFFSLKDISGLEMALNGVRYEKEHLENALKCANEFIYNADGKEIANAMFE